MMVAPMALRILLLEDVPADAALIERHLTKSGLDFVSQRVDTRARFEQALREFVPDIILSDHGLPGFDGSAALELVNERFPTLPVILVTGSLNEEKAVEFMKAGAADYILKDHLTRLPEAIQRAIRERRLREEREQAVAALQESEAQYRALFESTPYPMWVFDLETHRVLAVNGAAIKHYGYSREEFLALRIEDLRPGEDIPALHRHPECVGAGGCADPAVAHVQPPAGGVSPGVATERPHPRARKAAAPPPGRGCGDPRRGRARLWRREGGPGPARAGHRQSRGERARRDAEWWTPHARDEERRSRRRLPHRSSHDSRRTLCHAGRHRHRDRDGRADEGPHLRAVLHDQARRQGDGARARDGVRRSEAERRVHLVVRGGGARHELQDLPAADRRRRAASGRGRNGGDAGRHRDGARRRGRRRGAPDHRKGAPGARLPGDGRAGWERGPRPGGPPCRADRPARQRRDHAGHERPGAVPAPDAGAAHDQDAVSVRLHRRRDPASRRPGRGRRLPAEAVFARRAGTQGPRSDRGPPLSELPLVARARGHGHRPAIIAGAGTFTYRDLLDASARVAACLLAGRDDLAEARVAFLAPPGFHYVAIQWGIWRAGGIAIPLAVSHPPAELEYVIRDADAETVVVYEDFAAVMQGVHLPPATRTVTTDEAVGTAPRSLLPRVAAGRRAMIVYTSGTTGRPKGVVTTHANIAAQVASLVTAWEWRADDWILLGLPLHPVHGIINVLTCALWAGARCEMLPKVDRSGEHTAEL